MQRRAVGQRGDTEDVVARRLAVQEELARALCALPDAQRTTLYLRYHEDLTPTTIAERTGVPLETVKTRLTRGLAALRADLEARVDGDGRAWLSALAPLATDTERRVANVSHWLSLPAAATIGVVALGALATGLWATRARHSELAHRPEARAAAALIGETRESAHVDRLGPHGALCLARAGAARPHGGRARCRRRPRPTRRHTSGDARRDDPPTRWIPRAGRGARLGAPGRC